MLGLSWPDDVIQVVIPLLAAAIALAWPMWQEYQRRPTFTRLVRAELLEAGPYPTRRSNEASWTEHLTKRFLHVDHRARHRHVPASSSPASPQVLKLGEARR